MKKEKEKRLQNKGPDPFKGIRSAIILVLLFVLVVTIGVFLLLYNYKGAPKTDADYLGDMQSATLAISAISISLISAIVTILTFYRERKAEIINSMVEINLSKVEKERDFLSRLLYLQSSNSHYFLGLQYDYLIDLGNDICNSNIDFKHPFLYIICSLLETHTIEKKDTDINLNEIYNQIIKFSTRIIKDKSISDYEKIDAVFMYVNAFYRMFRYELDNNPDNTNIENLDLAIDCLEQHNIAVITSNIKISSAQLNLMGLVYYWKYRYLLIKKETSDAERFELIRKAKNYLEEAKNKNNSDEHIRNHYGCSLIGMGIYYASAGNVDLSNTYYNHAFSEFKSIVETVPTYEKPYINLIDICCLKIRLALNLTRDPYLLSPIILKEGGFDAQIDEQIKIGQSYYQNAQKSGNLSYNVYYKIAELETYRLLLSWRKGDGEADNIKKIVIDCLNKSDSDKQTIKSLKRKRQFYELCGDDENMNKINLKIMEVDCKNAEAWDSLIKEREAT